MGCPHDTTVISGDRKGRPYNPLPTTERLSDGAILSAAQKIPALRRKSPRSAPFMPYNGEKGVNYHEKPPEK